MLSLTLILRLLMKRQILAVSFTAVGLLVGSATVAQQQGAQGDQQGRPQKQREFRPMKLKPNAAQWEKYLVAGEQYKQKGDEAHAKQYIFEALTQLEKAPRKTAVLSMSISRLEHDIIGMYPKYPPRNQDETPVTDGARQIKIDEEQIAAFSRLNRINQIYPSPNNLMFQVVGAQIVFAKADLKKNQDEQKNKGKDVAGKDASGKDAAGTEAAGKSAAQ
jgi:hypothetical protein